MNKTIFYVVFLALAWSVTLYDIGSLARLSVSVSFSIYLLAIYAASRSHKKAKEAELVASNLKVYGAEYYQTKEFIQSVKAWGRFNAQVAAIVVLTITVFGCFFAVLLAGWVFKIQPVVWLGWIVGVTYVVGVPLGQAVFVERELSHYSDVIQDLAEEDEQRSAGPDSTVR